MNREEKLNEIAEKIRILNPNITNELLDLFYQYVEERISQSLSEIGKYKEE